jgi:hypothetical protein
MKYQVMVEKQMLVTGVVEVESTSSGDAVFQVSRRIYKGELQTTDVQWDDPEYIDHTFKANCLIKNEL